VYFGGGREVWVPVITDALAGEKFCIGDGVVFLLNGTNCLYLLKRRRTGCVGVGILEGRERGL